MYAEERSYRVDFRPYMRDGLWFCHLQAGIITTAANLDWIQGLIKADTTIGINGVNVYHFEDGAICTANAENQGISMQLGFHAGGEFSAHPGFAKVPDTNAKYLIGMFKCVVFNGTKFD